MKNKLLIFLALTGVLFILAVSYFVYYRFRRSANVYVSGILVKNINYPNTGIYWIPYWMADSLKANDKEYSPIGGLNATVVDKETITDKLNGQQVNLLLKIRAIKDRSGMLLYKNKPLSVGNIIEMRFPKTTVNLLITGIDDDKPKYNEKKIIVNTIVKDLDTWQADLVKIGSEIRNNKNEVLAKVTGKSIEQIKLNQRSLLWSIVDTENRLKRDLLLTIELTVKEKNNDFYFFDLLKITPNQGLYLPWKEGNFDHTIISVTAAAG